MIVHAYRAIQHYFSGYFSYLLVFLILLFVLRPGDRGIAYLFVWKIIFAGVLFSATFNCLHKRWVRLTSFGLLVPTLTFHFLRVVLPHIWLFDLLAYFFTLVFLLICTFSVLFMVVLRAKVTLETLRGAICVYLMIGFAFAISYTIVEHFNPHSFFLSHLQSVRDFPSYFLSEMMYFSFVTLVALGYGDIVAISDVGQTLAVLEGIVGQFYLAILVARLVSVYSHIRDYKQP